MEGDYVKLQYQGDKNFVLDKRSLKERVYIEFTEKVPKKYRKSTEKTLRKYLEITEKIQKKNNTQGWQREKIPCYNSIMKNCIANKKEALNIAFRASFFIFKEEKGDEYAM